MVMGRPTKYHEGMPELLYKAMAAGKSVVRFCSDHDISTPTFYDWVHKYPDFSCAFDISANKCEAHWEEWLIENLGNKEVNSTLIKLFFANRFGWSDKKEQAINLTNQEEIPRAIRQAEDALK